MAIQSKSREKLLVSKDKVSAHVTATVVVGGSITGSTMNTLEVFDENGVSLGFIALFDTVDLT